MKTSILFLSACCAMILAACSENKDYYNEEVANDAAGIVTPDLSNMASLESFQVTAGDIVPGMVTIVKCNGQLIAATQEPITIDVPKSTGASTRAVSNVEIEQITPEAYKDYLVDEKDALELPYWKLWQVVCFEDTKALDFDYNDLVLHVKTQRSGNKLSVGVQCVAMGNTKQISLGLQIMQKDVQGNYSQTFDNKIVIEDCKKTFFPKANPTEFVNTVVDKQDSDRANHCVKNFTTVYSNNEISGDVADYVVLYYIKTADGQTIYAIPGKHGIFPNMIATESLSNKGWPLGFTVAETGLKFKFDESARNSVTGDVLTTESCGLDWFDYPIEQKNICEVYPGFKDWVTGDGTGVFMNYGSDSHQIYYDEAKTAADSYKHYMFNVNSFSPITNTYPAIENGLYALTEKQGN